MIKKWLWRIVRLLVTAFILLCLAQAVVLHPIGTPVTLTVIFLMFVVFEWPYKMILEIFLHVSKSNIVWNIHPFKKIVLCYKRKNYTGKMTTKDEKHEKRHLWQVEKWTAFVWVVLYLLGLIWYAYEDHPFEVDARAAENE